METQEFVVKVTNGTITISNLPESWNNQEIKAVLTTIAPILTEEVLNTLLKDVLWMSETDAPWKVTALGKKDNEDALAILKSSKKLKEPIEQYSLDEFFKYAIVLQDWHSETERQQTQQYQALTAFIKANTKLSEVYKSGEIEKQVFVILKDLQEDWFVLQTESVET